MNVSWQCHDLFQICLKGTCSKVCRAPKILKNNNKKSHLFEAKHLLQVFFKNIRLLAFLRILFSSPLLFPGTSDLIKHLYTVSGCTGESDTCGMYMSVEFELTDYCLCKLKQLALLNRFLELTALKSDPIKQKTSLKMTK